MNNIVRLGADPFPPYQFLLADKTVGGSDYSLIKGIFAKCSMEVDVTIAPWEEVEGMFKRKELDALFQVQKNEKREKDYFFSKLLRNAVTEILTSNRKLAIDSCNDIEKDALILGVLSGYAYGVEIDNINIANKRFYGTQLELLHGISGGEVDCGVCDRGVWQYLAESENIADLVSLENLKFVRPLFVMFKDDKLCRKFSEAQDY